jgi:hypothetical protein
MRRPTDGKKGGKGYVRSCLIYVYSTERNHKAAIGGVVHAMFHYGRRIKEGNNVVDTFARGSNFIVLSDHEVYKQGNMLDTFD